MRVLRFDGMRVHRHGSVRSGGIESLGRKEPYRTVVVLLHHLVLVTWIALD